MLMDWVNWSWKAQAVATSNADMGTSNLGHAFLWPFKWALSVTLIFFCLGFFIIALNVTAMHFWWDTDAPVEYAQAIFEKSALATTDGGIESFNAWVCSRTALFAYWLFFKVTYIHQAVERFADATPVNAVDTFYRNYIIVPHQNEIYVAMSAIQTFGVRIGLLVTALPLLVLAYIAGWTDGLVERYIRRAGAGRESSSLYHRAKYLQLTGGVLGAVAFLCAPWHVNLVWMLLPAALFTAWVTRVQWKYYKKYL
jgi:integrating conjugative element membrane protein (TIGR03747 family)